MNTALPAQVLKRQTHKDTRHNRVFIETNIKVNEESIKDMVSEMTKRHMEEIPASNLISRS